MLLQQFKGIDSERLYNTYGGTNWSEGHVKFQQDVKHLLETPLGSMLGNTSYGSKIYQLLFLPDNEATGTLIQEEIRRTIESNYTDIKVQSVDISFGEVGTDKANCIYASLGISNGNSDAIDYINIDFERSGE